MEYQIYWSHLTPEAQDAFMDLWHPNIEMNPLAIIDVDPKEILYDIEKETDRKIIKRFAKHAENNNNWVLAEHLWIKLGYQADADACRTIIDANARGDMYRERIQKEAGPEPPKNDPHARSRWYQHISQIYREIYYPSENE